MKKLNKKNFLNLLEDFFSTSKGLFLIFVIFTLVSFALFFDFGKIYFLQDEWIVTARQIYNFNSYGILGFFKVAGTHLVPLSSIFWFIQYKLFGVNTAYYAYVAVFLHGTASFVSFLFLRKFIKNNVLSFVLSFIFLIHFNTTLTIVWLAVYYTYLPSYIFTLLSFIYFINCSQKGSFNYKNGLVLFILVLIAISFLESAIVAVLLIPFYWLLFWPKSKRKTTFLPVLITFALMIGLIAIRFIAEMVGGEKIVYEQGNQLAMTIYNFLTVPVKLLIQSFFLIDFLWQIARNYTHLAFPLFKGDGLMQEIVVLDLVFLFILLIMTTFFLIVFNRNKNNSYAKKIFFFSLVWFLITGMIIGVQSRHLYHMEFRYLYQPTIAALLLVYSLLLLINDSFKNHRSLLIKLEVVIVIIFTTISIGILRSKLPSYYETSNIRKNIIGQILNKYPTIDKKTVFYSECRERTDCLSNNLVLPFQSGVGQMLLVLYGSKNEDAYYPFMGGFYLWDMESQGYKEINGYGFGYFRDLEKINKLVNEGKIIPEDVTGFSYDRSQEKIEDISPRIRKQILKKISNTTNESI